MQAYRHAADTLRHLTRPAEEILRQEGESGLRKLPCIGESWHGLRGETDSASLPRLYRELESG